MKPTDPKSIKQHFAGIFLVTESGKVIGQHRDDIPTIDNPGLVSAFGGTVEPNEEPIEAAWREVTQEETNLKFGIDNVHHLLDDIYWRKLTGEWEVRHFYYASIKDSDVDNLEVYEGQGFAYISGPEDPNIHDSWRPVVKLLFETLNLPVT